jgi:hypothetical protein
MSWCGRHPTGNVSQQEAWQKLIANGLHGGCVNCRYRLRVFSETPFDIADAPNWPCGRCGAGYEPRFKAAVDTQLKRKKQ